MSGFLQRLMDRAAPTFSVSPTGAARAASAARSLSPMVEHDQRLQDVGFRGLMGLLPSAPAEAPLVDPAPDAPVVASVSARPAGMPQPPRAAPTRARQVEPAPPARAPVAEVARERPAAFDPIAALRRAGAGPVQDVAPPTTQPAPPAAAVPAMEAPRKPHARPSAEPPTRGPATPRMSTADGEPAQPPITDRLPTDPPAMDALPPERPLPEPVRPIAALRRPQLSEAATISEDLREEPAATPEPQPVRPASPGRANAAPPPAPTAPDARDAPVERIVERIVREVRREDAPAPEQPPRRVTANSVSRIGALPLRRRAHTIFGLRRG